MLIELLRLENCLEPKGGGEERCVSGQPFPLLHLLLLLLGGPLPSRVEHLVS